MTVSSKVASKWDSMAFNTRLRKHSKWWFMATVDSQRKWRAKEQQWFKSHGYYISMKVLSKLQWQSVDQLYGAAIQFNVMQV